MNRKQRRASQSSPATTRIESADQIPLRVPERYGDASRDQKTKTLYEIAAEKQAELVDKADRLNAQRRLPSKPDASNLVTVKVGPDGTILHGETNEPFNVEDLTSSSDQLPALVDTLMLSISLCAVHFTLEFLTVHQYAQELELPPIMQHTLFVAFPTFTFLIHLMHGHIFGVPFLSKKVKYLLLQLLFVSVANVSGCYLIQLTNDRGYFAVMKKAPSIGTVWVWCVIELGLVGALLGVIGPGLYAWWYGYSVL